MRALIDKPEKEPKRTFKFHIGDYVNIRSKEPREGIRYFINYHERGSRSGDWYYHVFVSNGDSDITMESSIHLEDELVGVSFCPRCGVNLMCKDAE